MRLSNASSGRVEVCYNGSWGTVCDDQWDITDATVLCQQLGYQRALGAYGNSYYGAGTGNVLMDNVRCTGSEHRLQDCPFKGWGVHDCGNTHEHDAGVQCKGGSPTNFRPFLQCKLIIFLLHQ